MEVLANIDLLQHLLKPKANIKTAIAPKAQGGDAGGNNNNKSTTSNTTTTTNNNNSRSTSEPETWTAEDDAQLRDLKTNSNMSWKQILATLSDKHTSETQMKARWKEIEGKAVGGAAAGGVEGSGGGDFAKAKKEEERKAKAEKAKAEGLAKQAAAEAGKGGGQPKKGILNVGGSPPLITPEVLSCGLALQIQQLTPRPRQTSTTKSATSQEKRLKDVAAKYDKDKWLAVASRHFDHTGQRISPEMAREMCRPTH